MQDDDGKSKGKIGKITLCWLKRRRRRRGGEEEEDGGGGRAYMWEDEKRLLFLYAQPLL